MKNKLTSRDRFYVKQLVKTAVCYVAVGVVINKTLDWYVKH